MGFCGLNYGRKWRSEVLIVLFYSNDADKDEG